MQLKKCSKCGEEKPLEEFYKDKIKKDGRKSICKICSLIADKEWREKNKERVKELKQNWDKANKERVKEIRQNWNKKWRSNNDNREKAKAAQREYNKKNSEKINAGERRRRENCRSSYIKSILKRQGFIETQITPELIEEKRNIIKVKRIIKQIKNKQNYE